MQSAKIFVIIRNNKYLYITVHPLCVHAIKKLNIVIASDSEAIRYKNKIQTSTKTGYFANAQYDKNINKERKYNVLKKILFTVHSKQFTEAIAFTLAETLIVMGIIGVVAALTLPNLNSSTGDKEKVAKVKKVYSNLNDALGRAQAVYGPYSEWCSNFCIERKIARLSEFLKTSKICNVSDSCSLAVGTSGTSDTSPGGDISNYNGVILADGTVVVIPNNTGDIRIDIDGPNKGPNIAGKDVFEFGINDNGIITMTLNGKDTKYVEKSGSGYAANQAASWIINFGNMDYLKTTDGTTCPDGTKLTFGGNHSCK